MRTLATIGAFGLIVSLFIKVDSLEVELRDHIDTQTKYNQSATDDLKQLCGDVRELRRETK